MAMHNVALRLDDEAYEALDRYAVRHRWSKSMAAQAIVSSYLALEPVVAAAEVSKIAQQMTLDEANNTEVSSGKP
jgi:predicted transcriptional regulator